MFTTPLLSEAKSHRNTVQFTKRNHVAKEAVSAAWQTSTRQRSERICKPNDAPKTKPRPCVKTMLHDAELPVRSPSIVARKNRRNLFGQPRVVRNQRTNHRPATAFKFCGEATCKIIDAVFGRVGNVCVSAFVGVPATTSNCGCLLYTSPSPRDRTRSRMPSSA